MRRWHKGNTDSMLHISRHGDHHGIFVYRSGCGGWDGEGGRGGGVYTNVPINVKQMKGF